MENYNCTKCGSKAEVICEEIKEVNNTRVKELILGCCECGHAWNEVEGIENNNE